MVEPETYINEEVRIARTEPSKFQQKGERKKRSEQVGKIMTAFNEKRFHKALLKVIVGSSSMRTLQQSHSMTNQVHQMPRTTVHPKIKLQNHHSRPIIIIILHFVNSVYVLSSPQNLQTINSFSHDFMI